MKKVGKKQAAMETQGLRSTMGQGGTNRTAPDMAGKLSSLMGQKATKTYDPPVGKLRSIMREGG